jgi:hypothetical protein
MKKSANLCFTLFLICGVFFASVSTASEEDNPVYQDWSQFKPGSSVVYKASTETMGMTTEVEMTYTLQEVTSEKVILELKTVTDAAGVKVESPAETMEIPAKGEGDEMFGDVGDMDVDVYDVVANGTRVSESTEKIEIKGTELEVQQIKVETDEAGSKVTATVWYSDEVPGRMVKSLTEVEGVVPVKSEMVVIDYKTIKE